MELIRMAATNRTNYTVSDLTKETNLFNAYWKRSFVNGRAIYVATSDKAQITIARSGKNGLIPRVRLTFKIGSKVVVIGTGVHYPSAKVQIL
ncbi:hypothetical protein [Paenibacillus sp. FSL R10-2734]|uniref:hypothetical protein n=1 Tax=Paenibacillus sp. FSL R10-2734 TaxID=2954691 RepID=UPI0030DCDB2A